jgi:hypothetical protein
MGELSMEKDRNIKPPPREGERREKPQREIMQIISAEGWQALYAIRPEENKNNPVLASPLACWALVQEKRNRAVVGLDRTLSFCDQGDNFLGYLAPGEKAKKWTEEAIRYLHQ